MLCAAEEPQSQEASKQVTCTVSAVIDGYTIVVVWSDTDDTPRLEKVRLIGIDTPETGELGFAESTEYLKELLDTEAVRLDFDGPEPKRDRYRRLLARLTVKAARR